MSQFKASIGLAILLGIGSTQSLAALPGVAAVTGKAELMDAANPGGLGGTYAGNPLGIAASNAVLDVIEEEQLCARANELGSRLKQRLEAIRSTTPEIIDIRGPGFMVAVEFANPTNHEPDAGFTGRVRMEALKRGLVAYVPQSEDVDWNFPVLVEDVVLMGRYAHMGFLRIARRDDRAAVDAALEVRK